MSPVPRSKLSKKKDANGNLVRILDAAADSSPDPLLIPTTVNIDSLHLSHFSSYFGTGSSKGLPFDPNCNLRWLWTAQDSTPVQYADAKVAWRTMTGRTSLMHKLFRSLFLANYRVPFYLYDVMAVPLPPPLSPPPTKIEHQFSSLSNIANVLQCTMVKALMSSASVEESVITNLEVYFHFLLLASVSELVGEREYSEMMLKDALKVLDVIELNGEMDKR